ncbi:MAG TPA: hypothetical protein VM204_02845 [Gaiellaceae bacterium]|nr:hypothetical protein [Gaiellaceae bacterium]
MIAHATTSEGVLAVDVEDELVLGEPLEPAAPPPRPELGLPRLVAADAVGATVVAVVDARPPLLVSRDGGATWSEGGRGLPPGFAVAIHPDDPDLVLYGGRNRLYLSRDGGRFWHPLEPELPDVLALAWA